MSISKSGKICICVGGTSDQNNGYNGGTGRGSTWGGGGGCTSITSVDRGVLANFSSYKSEVILVAGGGGGVDYGGIGGHGGGDSGGDGYLDDLKTICATGGTQTSGGTGENPGSFGQGALDRNGTDGSAGGGGGWYGGGSHNYRIRCGAGGGSGYINTSKITNGSMKSGINLASGKALITWHPAL